MAGEEESAIREWVSIRHGNGRGSVIVSLVQDNLSVKWAEKAYIGQTKKALTLARKYAYDELKVLRETLAELQAADEEAA